MDDHQIFGELLAEALTGSGLRVLGVCNSVVAALDRVTNDPPDVVVLDHSLPSGTGAGAVAAIKRLGPRVLMLTASRERSVVQEAMDAGCDGFVTKAQSLASVIDAVHAVTRGETPVSADVAGAAYGRPATSIGSDLTARESSVLQLIGAGLTNQQIADDLHISPNTVRNHVQHVLTKLDAHSKLEAVAVAARNGLLASDRRGSGKAH
ncbi:MAG: response regulator transcription factor [Nocardioides sp.]|nr:response regulator transcription factor [Nocardioides sp.]